MPFTWLSAYTGCRSSNMEEQRLVDLEIQLMHQQRLVEELNELVYQQQQTIDGLVMELAQIKEQVQASFSSLGREPEEESPPPHY
jgi:SlyX protein